ncbi:MAG: ATP-binding protein [Thermodesulfobacteriota bacterium]|jgi:PAS domain S-box-containing protein
MASVHRPSSAPAALRAALDTIAYDSLGPVALGLSGLYAFFTFTHLVVLPAGIAPLMSATAAGTALVLLSLALVLRARPLPVSWAHPVGAGIAALVLLNSLLLLGFLDEPRQTTNVMLLVIGVGLFFLSPRWFIGVLAAILLSWGLVARQASPSAEWVHFGFGLLSATVLAGLVYTVRVRTFARLEGLRLQHEARNRELEAALRALQDSEAVVRRLNGELEARVAERTAALREANTALRAEIAARKQAEEALQRERDLFVVTLSSIGDAVMATDARGAVTFLNPVAEALTGWPTREALGHPIDVVFRIVNEQTRQAVESPVTRVLREGVVVGLANHTVLLSRDGREIPIADSGAPIRDTTGQVYGVVLVFRDATESRRAEAALRQAKEAAEAANQAKSDFLATISHELRTPLHVILGYIDLLLEAEFGRLGPAQIDTVRRIERNARVLFELISMVLDLNRLEFWRLPLEVTAVRVAEVFSEIQAETQWLREHSGLAFLWDIEPPQLGLVTDARKLKVVLKNLLSNAIKYTREGSVRIAARAVHGGVEIRVADTGIGIPAAQRETIFEAFHQLDPHGTQGVGLGLYIVRRLVELLQGTVTVESEVGRGSTFRVWVPARPREEASAPGVT